MRKTQTYGMAALMLGAVACDDGGAVTGDAGAAAVDAAAEDAEAGQRTGPYLLIECVVVPKLKGGSCLYEFDGPCKEQGTLNVAVASTYDLSLSTTVVAAPADGGSADPAANATDAKVWLTTTAGVPLDFDGELPNPFTVSTSSWLAPSAIVPVRVLPRAYVETIAAWNLADQIGSILAEVRLQGRTEQNQGVTSDPLRWTIELQDLAPAAPATHCSPDPSTGEALQCEPGQDGDATPLCSSLE